MVKRREVLAGMASGVAVGLAGRGASAQARGGDVVIAIVQAPPSLDAQVTSAQAARDINLHIYESLFARDENARPVPDLAKGVTVSADGRTYVFPLREGVKFHNGKPLGAEDVVASIERYRRLGATPTMLAPVDTVKASGPREVTVTLKEVQSTFLDNLSSPRAPLAIYPAEEAAKPSDKLSYIGTGPFRFVEYKPDSHVKLARFDGYVPNPAYKGLDGFAGHKEAFLDTVTFRFMPEAGARNAALETGAVHLVETVDGDTAKRLQGNGKLTVYKLLPFSFQVIKFNHAAAPGGDVNFRRAVQKALDMEEIMSIAYPDINQLDGSWVYPNSAYYTTGGAQEYNKQNLAEAKALLAKSGYKGQKLVFIVDNLRENVDVATVFQQRLRDLGVNVVLSVSDWPTVSKVGFTDQGWNFWTHGFGIEPYEGPASVMAPWVNGVSQRRDDPKIDALAKAYNAEMEEAKRKQIFVEFQGHMYDQAVAIKAGNYGMFQVATSRLKNFVPYRIPRMWGVTLSG